MKMRRGLIRFASLAVVVVGAVARERRGRR
jgi:hypothetical protein